jgi:hypothetical protein
MRALNATGAGEFITVTPIDRAIKRADGGRPLSIGPIKTGNRRDVEMTDVLLATLRRHRIHQAEVRFASGGQWTTDARWTDLVFTSEVGTPIDPSHARRDVKKICAHAGVPTLSLHEPRDTVASLMVDSDVPLREVADLLGHKDLEMVVDPVILASTRKHGIADTTCSTPTDTRSECSASTMPTNLPSGSRTMTPTPTTSARSRSTCSNAPFPDGSLPPLGPLILTVIMRWPDRASSPHSSPVLWRETEHFATRLSLVTDGATGRSMRYALRASASPTERAKWCHRPSVIEGDGSFGSMTPTITVVVHNGVRYYYLGAAIVPRQGHRTGVAKTTIEAS